ncbi:MAG: sulfite exporter TauE/SafE family protein [Leptospiraceae bacterium]|nr:sulfite exporter TauE/SafE family protein [Leptospiraceae bacterium]
MIIGSIVGLLAGMFGVGGGVIIVPFLTMTFTSLNFSPEIISHLALGTSMGSILFTSVSSFTAHHRHGSVYWDAVFKIVLGILIGTFMGSFVVSMLSTLYLQIIFIVFEFYIATYILLDIKASPSRSLPGRVGMSIAGYLIGFISSLVGIGGGILSTTFLTWCNVNIQKAIGTSAAIGFPIALAGSLGYIINGWGIAQLPEYSLGFVYLPALGGLIITGMLFAPVGANIANKLPVKKLRKLFALFLYVIGFKMLYNLYTG